MSMRYPGGLIATNPVNQQFPSGVWTGPQSTPYQTNNVWGNDPYFKNTSLLLQGGGSVAPFIKDTSTNNFNLTINGDVRADSKTPFTPPSGVTTYGSGYFDGTGDYLNSPNINFASSNFTIEGWFYPTTIANLTNFWGMDNGSGSTPKMIMYINSSGNLTVDMGNAGTTQFPVSASASTYLTANAWNHIAVVRSGTGAGQFALYINGTSVSTGQLGTNISSITATFNIGYIGESYGQMFSGYVSNFRIVNGTAVYTSGFTTPTNPLAAIANTALLTLQSNVPVNNNTLIAASPSTATMIRGASTTQGSFSPFITNGYWSNYFDGSGDRLDVANNAALQLNSGNFTIEAWVYYTTATSYFHFFSKWNSGDLEYQLVVTTSTGEIGTSTSSNGSSSTGGISSVGAVFPNVWQHIAWVRNGATDTIYVNGVSVASGAGGTIRAGTSALSFGGRQDGSYYGNGYLSNARLVKGTAVYTANFTPPTVPLTAITNTSLLTCQSNRFLDNSTNAFTVSKNGDVNVQAFDPFPPPLEYTANNFYGSASLVSGDYFQVAGGSPTSIGNFSASAWIYRSSVSGSQQTFCSFGEEGPGRGVFFWTGSNFEYNIYGSSSVTIDGTGSMPVGAWTYVVLTRTGSTLSLYYNGSLKNSVSLGTAFTNTSDRKSGYGGVIGYVANYRLDYAAYPSPTTVPTAPVSYTASTLLLANFTNAGIYDSTGQNNLVTVGNSQLNTSVVKYGTGSMYFDGSGDYLSIPGSASMFLGTGNFTVEMWVNISSLAATRALISFANSNVFYINTSGIVYYGIYTVADYSFASSAIPINTWVHLAFCRVGSIITCFVNGVSTGTTVSSSAAVGNTTSTSYIGYHQSGNAMFGYIDDLRVTKGVARYVGNFTPPVARMPNQ